MYEGWYIEKWVILFFGFCWVIFELFNFEGCLIYMDVDVIVLCDIVELWLYLMKDDVIVIVKGGKSLVCLCICVWDCKKVK